MNREKHNKTKCSRESAELSYSGMQVARHIMSVLIAFSMPACLITEELSIPEDPNFPPGVVSAPSATFPLDQVVEVDRDMVTGDVELEIVVRDANVDQELQMQVYVDFVDSFNASYIPQANDNRIIATGTVERSLTLRVPVARLGNAGECHKIELLVSSGFQGFPNFRLPELAGDLHQSVWWVALTDTAFPTVDMSTCPR